MDVLTSGMVFHAVQEPQRGARQLAKVIQQSRSYSDGLVAGGFLPQSPGVRSLYWLEGGRKELRPIDPVGRIIGRFYHTNPGVAQRTIEDIGAVFWAIHPALHRAFWGEPASGNIFGDNPKLIAGILHALRWRSSIAPSMLNKPMYCHILAMGTGHLD